MKKIGVFGGTFNPVHKGHEQIAVDFYKKFDLSKLIVIPTNIPPHKQADDIINTVSPVQRLEMCRICFNAEKYRDYNIEVSDIEIKKDGISYSYDTVKSLREIYGYDEYLIYFLVGSDMFLYLEQWHKYRELLEICVFTVALRYNKYDNGTRDTNDGEEEAAVLKMRDRLTEQGYKIELLKNIPFEISSTDLRKMIKSGDLHHENFKNLENYISPEVLDYIKERKIYVLQ